MSEIISSVRETVAKSISNKEQSVAHKMDHLRRVEKNALQIAANYANIDKEALQLAVLLHDVDQPYNDKKNHVERSKRLAAQILFDVGYPGLRSEKVLKIIDEHSTETIHSNRPSTIEAKILFDADKIDGVGPNGIIRVFSLFSQMGKEPIDALPWYREKIRIALNNMQTYEGKEIFVERLKIVTEFLYLLERDSV